MPPKKRKAAESDYEESDASASEVDLAGKDDKAYKPKAKGAAKRPRRTNPEPPPGQPSIKMPSVSKRRAAQPAGSGEVIKMPAYQSPEPTPTKAKAKSSPKKESAEPVEEKRLSKFKPTCPQDVKDRYAATTKKYVYLIRSVPAGL